MDLRLSLSGNGSFRQDRDTVKKIHYGWIIVFSGMLCIFGCIGLGRFALGMLLPAMAAPLKLSYSMMGVISTANFIGYLLAVLLCGKTVMRYGARKVISLALLLVGGSMVAVGMTSNYALLVFFYTATGVGSALANVPMMSLTVSWFSKSVRGRASGFIVIGSGFAILLSGRMVPAMNAAFAGDGWRYSWFVLGALVICIALFCALVLRNDPREMGLKPVTGTSGETLSFDEPAYGGKDIFHLAAIYFLFGASYVIYATFLVTSLVQDKGLSEAQAGAMWSWVGILSLLSGPVFGTLSDWMGRRFALMVVFSLQAVAYLLAASRQELLYLSCSAVAYGLVAWSIPSIMAALVGDVVGARKASAVFGFVTFIFAIGQIIGPALAGYLAEAGGSFSPSFYLAAVMAVTGVLLSTFLKKDGAAAAKEIAAQK